MLRTWFLVIFAATSCLLYSTVIAYPTEVGDTQLLQLAQEVMRYHERVTGIAYPEQTPKMEFVDDLAESNFAVYFFEKQTITFHGRYRECDFTYIRIHLYDRNLPSVGTCPISEFRTVLSHELGHWLTHTLIIHQFQHSWLKKYFVEKTSLEPETVDAFMILEGIGEYYGSLMGSNDFIPFPEEAWERKLTKDDLLNPSTLTFYAYGGGYNIVQGILDAQGAADGMYWILNNKPKIRIPSLKGALAYKHKGMNFKKN